MGRKPTGRLAAARWGFYVGVMTKAALKPLSFKTMTMTALFALALAACGGGADSGSGDGAGGTSFDATSVDTSGLPSSFPALADRIIDDSGEVTTLLSGVTDAASAEAIKPRLAQMAEGYRAVLIKFEEMGDPGFSDMAALASRLPKIATSQTGLLEQVERIYREHPEAYDVLAESLEGLNSPTP